MASRRVRSTRGSSNWRRFGRFGQARRLRRWLRLTTDTQETAGPGIRVRKLMQQHDIKANTNRKFVVTTDSRHSLPVAPDLVQQHFNPKRPTSSGITISPPSKPGGLAIPGRRHRSVW